MRKMRINKNAVNMATYVESYSSHALNIKQGMHIREEVATSD